MPITLHGYNRHPSPNNKSTVTELAGCHLQRDDCTEGVSTMQLSKEIGVQYSTAWHMLHRIREACQPGKLKLSNVAEIDESYIGGKESNKHADKKLNAGRGTVGKTAVVGAKERDGAIIASPERKTVTRFAVDSVETGAVIYTADSRIYGSLPFEHESVNHSQEKWGRGD